MPTKQCAAYGMLSTIRPQVKPPAELRIGIAIKQDPAVTATFRRSYDENSVQVVRGKVDRYQSVR